MHSNTLTACVMVGAALMLSACASTPKTSASATITPRSGGMAVGTLAVVPMRGGVHVSGAISGLTPGSTHAFHIHENGDCSAADASSAGGHFNPTTQPHGRAAAGGAHHLGDQDNLSANDKGVAIVSAHFRGVSLGSGEANDVNGKAIVVHAHADDYTSQPAGNAGKRIGCGVIRVR